MYLLRRAKLPKKNKSATLVFGTLEYLNLGHWPTKGQVISIKILVSKIFQKCNEKIVRISDQKSKK